MNSERSYYDTLELPRGCTPEDIKKAFRRLALKYHPDRNKETDAAERFKTINEAYQVLSDPQLRAKYDRFGRAGVNGRTGRGFDGFEGFGGLGDIFEAFFGDGEARQGPRRGRDLEYEIAVDFEAAAFGKEYEVPISRSEMCARCRGSRAESGTELETCQTCRGSGQVRRAQRMMFGQFTQVSTCSTCAGAGHTVPSPCSECSGRGVIHAERKIAVEIPAGIESGSRIRLAGEGEPGEMAGSPGDLYIYVSVKPHELFVRDGNDVRIGLNLNIAHAALGTKVEVPTLEGAFELSVPSGTQSGETLKIKGRGIPVLGRGGRRGDQLVVVRVATPEKLTSHQRELLEELAGTFHRNGSGGE